MNTPTYNVAITAQLDGAVSETCMHEKIILPISEVLPKTTKPS